MKQFVYPAVLYLDEEASCYTVAFHDLNLFTEGDTVEDAFLSAKEFLEAYFECAVEFDEDAEDASEYLSVSGDNKKNIVLLVDTKVEKK